MGFPGDSVVKNLPAMQELQEPQVQSRGQEDPMAESMAAHFSILTWRIPLDRRAWQSTVHRIARSQTQLKQLNMQICMYVSNSFCCTVKINTTL